MRIQKHDAKATGIFFNVGKASSDFFVCELPAFKNSKGTGGGTGIRTPVRCYPQHAFQACALSHSATPPTFNQKR